MRTQRSDAPRRLLALFSLTLFACGGQDRDRQPLEVENTELSSGAQRWRFGVNAGWQDSLYRMPGVIRETQTLGASTVRMDIRVSHSPQHYAQVMDYFAASNIDVLVVFTGSSWHGQKRDAHHYHQHRWQVCSHYAPWHNPSQWGTYNVIPYLDAIRPYVDAIRHKRNLIGIELWNEVTNAENHLCAADYAYMMTEAKLRWPELRWGTSTEGANYGDYASHYMWKLAYNTDKVNWYKATHGGGPPYDIVMHHPYGAGQWTRQDVSGYLAHQFRGLGWSQIRGHERPIWFTEIGWQTGQGEDHQARMLEYTMDTVLDPRSVVKPERVFWYALYDCTPGFGLIRNRCWDTDGNGYRRPAWYSMQRYLQGW